MSSVAKARSVTEEIGNLLAPNMPAKVKYDRIYAELIKILPEDLLKRFTRRRVRSLHNGEARRVDHEEMIKLEELRSIQKAKHERLKLAATADRLARLLEQEGAPLDSRQLSALRRLSGQQNSAGNSGNAG